MSDITSQPKTKTIRPPPGLSSYKRTRAGVIPYTYNEELDLVILLGKEIYGKWSPFAGTVEKNEKIPEAASREFVEEVMGFFNYQEVLEALKDTEKILLSDSDVVSNYYLLPIDYDLNLPRHFQNVTQFLLKYTDGKLNRWGVPVIGSHEEGLFEKSQVQWFVVKEVINMPFKKRYSLFTRDTSRAINWLADNFTL